MKDIIKGYCILWEKHLQEEKRIFNFNYLNNMKVCDYKTLRKLKEGVKVYPHIYKSLFLSLNVKYEEDEKLDYWLEEKINEFKDAYEYFNSDLQEKILDEIKERLQGKVYPYQMYDKVIDIVRTVLLEFHIVSTFEQGMLYKLLQIDYQPLKTILSLTLVWNKTRVMEEENSIYEYAMKLPFIDDYIGLYTKSRMSLLMKKYDDFLQYNEASQKFIKPDNIFAQMKHYAFMEGYYDSQGEIVKARPYLEKYREMNEQYKDSMGTSFYASNCYYLWISYYMIDEFELSYEYMEKNFSHLQKVKLIEKIVYFSLCNIKGIKPSRFDPFEIDVKKCKGINKQRVQYFQMLYSDQPSCRRREYLVNRYQELTTTENGLDLKIIENELKILETNG